MPVAQSRVASFPPSVFQYSARVTAADGNRPRPASAPAPLRHGPVIGPSVALGRSRLQDYVHIKNGFGLFSIRPPQYRLARGTEDQRAANAFASLPRAPGDPTDVAGPGNPELKIARHRSVILQPERAIRFPLVVMIGGHTAQADGERMICAPM